MDEATKEVAKATQEVAKAAQEGNGSADCSVSITGRPQSGSGSRNGTGRRSHAREG
jgi:hypothetical protein